MSAISLIVVLLATFFDVATASASVTAVCNYAQWTYYNNQTPCQIWGNLQAVCDPNASVPVLDVSTNSFAQYPTPSGSNATACQCNVVAYNLMAGCSWCQPNVYSVNWVSEAAWRAGCSNYDATGLPAQASSVSSGIPPWAFEVENGNSWGSFDASTFAASGATATSGFTAFGVATDGLFSTTAGGSFSTGTARATATRFGATGTAVSGDNISKKVTSDVGKAVAIAVGIIAGVIVLFFGTGLIICCVRQNRRKTLYGRIAAQHANGGGNYMTGGDVNVTQPLLPGGGALPGTPTLMSQQSTPAPSTDASQSSPITYPQQFQQQQPVSVSPFSSPGQQQEQGYDASLLYQTQPGGYSAGGPSPPPHGQQSSHRVPEL